jgi:predicted O-methyltransferase YrrM
MNMMLQVDQEIDTLAELFKAEGVRSFLEIGSKFGGSLERIGNVLPRESRIVSVDLPDGTRAWKESSAALTQCIARLKAKGHDARVIWGNSMDAAVVEQVRVLGPFDAILIDADHRLPGVTADWNNYGPMGRLVAFHDIAWRRAPEWVGTRIDVPEFWDKIKGDFAYQELKFCPTGKNNGIGVLWRH